MDSLISTALRPLQIPMELHNIALQTNVPKGIIVQGDSGWLSEAIRNILKNCMESVGDSGKIEITCEDTLLFTELTIHDSGPGFKKEDLLCLFDRFYRADSSRSRQSGGYGIGLSIAKAVTEGHKGRIGAAYEAGNLVFTVVLPCIAGKNIQL